MAITGIYGKKAPNQMVGYIANPCEGLNEYVVPMRVGDNQLSDCRDVLAYRNSAIMFDQRTALTAINSAVTGYTLETIADTNTSGQDVVYSLMANGSSGYIEAVNIPLGTNAQYSISGFTLGSPSANHYGSCLYATDAAKYVVFCQSNEQKLYFFNGTSVSSVALQFYPKKIVSHAMRIFAIDTGNKIWWSKAGAFTSATDWYGSASTTAVMEDAGLAPIPAERTLADLAVLGNNLYVFGSQNIYLFSGYSYDNFSIQVAIADLGVKSDASIKYVTQTGKNVYFMSTYQSTGNAWLRGETVQDIFEYNGSDYPVIINRQVIDNGTVTNGMLGSADIAKYGLTHLASDEMYLYVYKRAHTSSDALDTTLYVFDIKYRTWWKQSGFNDNQASLGDTFKSFYIPSQSRDTSYAVVNNSTTSWQVFNDVGLYGSIYPFITTKAYATLPSDKETLTSVIFQIKAVSGTDLHYTLYGSKTVDQNDFFIIKDAPHFIANGEIQLIEIFLPVSLVSGTTAYRLKLQISGGKCYLYNIERRYRVRGRSR